jgi:PST family polysaccharide transporter
VGITLVAQLTRAAVQFVSLIVLARLLDPKDFGVVAAVTAVISIADVLRDFGLSTATIQAKTLNDDERTNLFWANLALGTFCGVAVAAAAPLIDHIYHQPLHQVTLALSVLFVLAASNTQFSAELTRSLRFTALAVSGITAQVVGAASAIVLAALGAGYWAIVAQQLITAGLVLVINIFQCRWHPGWPRRRVSIRRFFRFGVSLLASQLIAYGTENADNITVGVARGPVELGYYSRAYQLLAQPLGMINAPLTKVALPVLSRVQDDDAVYSRYLQRAQLVGCYLTATVMAVACGLSGPVVAVLFGHGWSPVAPIFALLAVGGIFRAVEQISYWMFLSRGKTGAQLRLYALTRPIMIGIIIAGIPWGAVGVAASSSVAYFLYWVVSLLAAGRATGVDVRPLFAKATQAIVLVSAPCGLAAYGASLTVSNPVLRLVIGLAAAAAYLAAVIALVPLVRTDASLVLRFASRAAGRGPRTPATPRPDES